VLHVDDLIKTGFEQIVVIGFFPLFRSHQNPQKQCLEGITNGLKSESKSQGNDYQTITFLQLGLLRISENPRRTKAAEVFHRRLLRQEHEPSACRFQILRGLCALVA
jgi:hypothetical protein